MVVVIAREFMSRSDESRGIGGRKTQTRSDSPEIYIRDEPKEGKFLLKKDDISKLE